MMYFPQHNSVQLILCIALPLFLALLPNTSSENMDSKALSAAVVKFSAKFCNELAKDKSVVSSPLSAEFVLALLTLGSIDDVHDELLTSLGIPDDDSIRSSFSAVSSKLKNIQGVTLNVANKVYIKDGPYELNPKLKEDAVKVFDADIEKIDFNNGAAAASTINSWVESKTNNRIKDLLSPDSLDGLTRLVLVNALYFKGTWAKQFQPHLTAPRAFHISEANTINVQMMYKEDKYRYGESQELDAQLLQLDYVGGKASMVIVLPGEINGLDNMLQKIASGYNLMQEIDNLVSTKVQVSIPKYKIETEIDLTELLPKLGINAIFDQKNSGLRYLLDVETPLYVKTAVQKAFIEVNEEGAEAAAATAVQKAFIEVNEEGAEAAAATGMRIVPESFRQRPQFRADRPFLYLLGGADGVPAFVGVYRGDPAL